MLHSTRGTAPGRPKRARAIQRMAIPSGAEAGHKQSAGLFVPGEGLRQAAQRGLQGQKMYPSDEG